MKVSITEIDQSFSLESGSVVSYAVIVLPSGRKVRAVIDEETMQSLVTESAAVSTEIAPRDPEVEAGSSSEVFVHEDFVDEGFQQEFTEPDPWPDQQSTSEPQASEGVVEWEKLPDAQLPPRIKQILRDSKINPLISTSDLELLKAQILEKIGDTPQPGKVTWNSGSKRDNQSKPRRTVPKDEMGNPLPPGGIMEVDPGEVQDDDDGVSQA